MVHVFCGISILISRSVSKGHAYVDDIDILVEQPFYIFSHIGTAGIADKIIIGVRCDRGKRLGCRFRMCVRGISEIGHRVERRHDRIGRKTGVVYTDVDADSGISVCTAVMYRGHVDDRI